MFDVIYNGITKHVTMSSKLFFLSVSYTLGCSGTGASAEECFDLHGRPIAQGLHYVPGPDTCTLCVCDNGNPKWCKAVLCSPPQDCKSFRVGNSCCEFICLDDTLTKTSSGDGFSDGGADTGLRLIATSVTIILFVCLIFFLVHRLRKRKLRGRQNRQLSEDERSLGSIGYIAGSLGYLPGSMGYLGGGNQERHLEFRYEEPATHFPLWKPPGNYFPRGEAPPPYEEAVAAARAEAALAANNNNNISSSNNTNNFENSNSANILNTGHRTIPINLATSGSFRLERSTVSVERDRRTPDSDNTSRPHSLEVTVDVNQSSESRRSSRILETAVQEEDEGATAAIRSDAFYEDVLMSPSPQSNVECYNPCVVSVPHTSKSVVNPSQTSPSNISFVSIRPHEGSSKLNDLNKGSLDDNDDYRSECENCKSAHGSRYYLDQDANVPSQETMTLHRRPQDYDVEDQSYYGTSLTLPTHSKRHRSSTLHGTPSASSHSARENWFSSMPASSPSSSSSEEE